MARSEQENIMIGKRRIKLTNQHKVLWPDDGLTKADLVAYYRAVSAAILPHLHDRPLTLKLYPDGIDAPPIFRQAAPRGTPRWIPQWPHHFVSRNGKNAVKMRLLAGEEAVLAWLANQNAIELHTWLSRVTAPEEPDMLLFDLDPGPEVSFDAVCRAALDVRSVLRQARLAIWPKTSGGKGMHLAVPLRDGYQFEFVRDWAERLAQCFQRRWPDRFTHLAKKEERAGRIMIDYAQNSLGRTTAAVYSARARRGAPVSAPLTWDEVVAGSAGKLSPDVFNLRTMPARLRESGDLYAPVLIERQRLPEDFNPAAIVETM